MPETTSIIKENRVALKEIARLHFTGNPYNVHALDVAALEELARFQKIVTKIATMIWKKNHPESHRLPKKFKKNTKFYFNSIQEGSVIVPIQISTVEQDNDMFNEYRNIHVSQAIDITHATLVSANHAEALPENIPQNVLQDIAKLGRRLPAQGKLGLELPGKDIESISENTRTYLMVRANNFYQDETDIIGKVLEADVKRKKFQLWIDNKMNISIPFTEEQESEIITALKEHTSTQVRVNVYGEYNSKGNLEKILQLNSIDIYNEDFEYDPNTPSIMEEVERIFGDVPEEIWNKLPPDLSSNHDFYIYGITELPSTIKEFLKSITGPLSPDKEYYTNYEHQIVEWSRKLNAVRNCSRCNRESIIDIEILQEKIMKYYKVPDEQYDKIANILMSLHNTSISTDDIWCQYCNALIRKDD